MGLRFGFRDFVSVFGGLRFSFKRLHFGSSGGFVRSDQSSEISLANLDNPMFPVGGMLINRDMRVAVQPRMFRNAASTYRGS